MSLEVGYKGVQIAQLTQDGSLTLSTGGKYCEGDIDLTYSGGSEKILLADYTAPSNVSEIAINGVLGSYDVYKIEINGSLSRTEWLYPIFNDTSISNYYFGTQAGANSYNTSFLLAKLYTGKQAFYAYGLGQASQLIPVRIDSAPQSLRIHLYYETSLFLAGFNVKIWGMNA